MDTRQTQADAPPDVFSAVRALLGSESVLLRAELAQAQKRVVSGLVMGVVAVLCAAAAVVAALTAGILGLAELGLDPWAATALLALVLLVVAVIAGLAAKSKLKAGELIPRRTIASLRELPATISTLVRRHA